MTQYYAAITGDVIGSKRLDQDLWISRLKRILSELVKNDNDWELFRGDSFQILLDRPENALRTAMQIKAEFKSHKNHDVRMAIGVGDIHYRAERVGESNGTALIRAGALIDVLPSLHTTLAISTAWPDFDKYSNPSLAMAAALMDKWLPNYAEAAAIVLKFPELKQIEQAKLLGIKQNTLSERLTRSYKRELLGFEEIFQQNMLKYLEEGE